MASASFSTYRGYFDRWKLGWERTSAYRLFKGHHTQLNSLYWAHAPALRYVFAATRTLDPNSRTDSFLSLPQADNTRINVPLREWRVNYGSFDNWVRLNALVSITGYLEVYVKTVTRLALESDPGLLIGMPRSVDGVAALKRSNKYSYAEEVIGCVRGTWHQRVAEYRRLFGTAPAVLDQNLNELDQLRQIRNGVTHTFGRSADEYDGLLQMTPRPFKRIDETKLKKTLSLVDQVALAIDGHLGPTHIGEYESMYFYHNWDKVYSIGHDTEARALSRHLGKLHGRTRNLNFYKGLIANYKIL